MTYRTVFLFTFLLALAVALAGCRSEPRGVQAEPEPLKLPSEVTLNFAQLPATADEPGAGLDDVLRLVSETAALNFTYSAEVGRGLAAAQVELDGTQRLRRGAIEGFLRDLLTAHGFELARVGPDALRTFLVEPSAGGPRDARFEAIALEHVAVAVAAEACLSIEAAGPITIVPDPRSNTLLVYARGEDITRIHAVVERLDVARESSPH